MARNRAPVGYTCPDIDKVISSLTSVKNNLVYYNKMSFEEFQEFLKDEDNFESFKHDLESSINEIEDIASGGSYALENLRSANSSLREWGSSLEEEKDDLERQLDKVIGQRDDYESQIKELEEEIESITRQKD